MPWKNYVLDVSMIHNDIPCWCPIEDDGGVVVGMNLIQSKCPGKMVGVFHPDGQEAVEEWCAANSEWRSKFG